MLLMDDYYHCGPIWFLGAMLIVKSIYNIGSQAFMGGDCCGFVVSSCILQYSCIVH